MAEDYLVRALCLEGKVRVYAIRSTQLVAECQRRHDIWATASAALGRTLSVGAMMGAMLKGNEKLTLQVRGNGPLGKVIVDANAKGEVRGYVDHPHTHLPLNEEGKLNVGAAVGEGSLFVTKDLGLREPYHGTSPLLSGEIGEDFTVYFAQSEQTPSAVAVGVMVNPDHSIKSSGGFIVQLMPGITEEDVSYIEERLKSIPPVSNLVDLGLTPEQMMETVFEGKQLEWLDKLPIHFRCHCSLERVKQSLISIGREELTQMIEEDGQAEIQCHFCNEFYHLDKSELRQLLEQL